MRFVQTLFVILLLVALQVRQEASQNQNAELGRVVGRVVDESGAAMPGANVTMTGRDGTIRHGVSDADGRFAFDGVMSDVVYSVRGAIPGFAPDEVRDVMVTAGQTRTIGLELDVGCVSDDGLLVTGLTDLDQLSRADAIAHVRMADVGEDLGDGCGPSREAVVLKVGSFSKAGQGLGATVRVLGADRFKRGKEYLVVLRCYGKKHPRIGVKFMREVVRGRISGKSAEDLPIRSGMRVDDALKRLQELREHQRR